MGGNAHGGHFCTFISQVHQHENFKEQQHSFHNKIEDHIRHNSWSENSHVNDEDNIQDNKDY